MSRHDRNTEEARQHRRNALPNIFEDPKKTIEEVQKEDVNTYKPSSNNLGVKNAIS